MSQETDVQIIAPSFRIDEGQDVRPILHQLTLLPWNIPATTLVQSPLSIPGGLHLHQQQQGPGRDRYIQFVQWLTNRVVLKQGQWQFFASALESVWTATVTEVHLDCARTPEILADKRNLRLGIMPSPVASGPYQIGFQRAPGPTVGHQVYIYGTVIPIVREDGPATNENRDRVLSVSFPFCDPLEDRLCFCKGFMHYVLESWHSVSPFQGPDPWPSNPGQRGREGSAGARSHRSPPLIWSWRTHPGRSCGR